jgi:autotransporter-associated beta strand protein
MRVVTNSNPVTIGGVISDGGLTKAGAGTLTLTATNTYSLGTLVSAGTLAGTTASLQGGITNNSALVFTQTVAGTYSGIISGTGSLTKQGVGAVTLTGPSTFSGNTTVSAGALIQNGTNVASAVTVSSGAFLYGTGSNAAVTVSGQISAGNGSNTVGNLKATALNLENNGRMQVNISAMTGTPGTDWDVITLGSGGGTYTVNAVDGSDFVIALKGSPATFDQGASYALIIVDAGTASGFVANKFTVDTSEFTPSGGFGSSSFTVDASGGDLRLIVTPAAPPAPADVAASDGTSTDHVAITWTDGVRRDGLRDLAAHGGCVRLGHGHLYERGQHHDVQRHRRRRRPALLLLGDGHQHRGPARPAPATAATAAGDGGQRGGDGRHPSRQGDGDVGGYHGGDGLQHLAAHGGRFGRGRHHWHGGGQRHQL